MKQKYKKKSPNQPDKETKLDTVSAKNVKSHNYAFLIHKYEII